MVFVPPDIGIRPLSRARHLLGRVAALLCLVPGLGCWRAGGPGRITGHGHGFFIWPSHRRCASDDRRSRAGATTDNQGRYSIVNVPAGPRIIDVRRIGYQPAAPRTVTIPDGGTVTADFRLREAALNLQAIVTTGVVDPTSGTRVPFTVGRVSAENLPVPATNALEAIQGKIAGVTGGSFRTAGIGHKHSAALSDEY